MKSSMPFFRLAALIFATLFVTRVQADEHATFSVGGFNFTRPAKWEWVEVQSAFRKAQLKVTDSTSNSVAEIVFFEFAGGAGSVPANVERWHRQFTEPRTAGNSKVKESVIGKTKVTYVLDEGTYNSGMPGSPTTPLSNYALSGAIIEGDNGNIFVRMTGPATLVKTLVADFNKMIESALK